MVAQGEFIPMPKDIKPAKKPVGVKTIKRPPQKLKSGGTVKLKKYL
jgi:hypothetical protein